MQPGDASAVDADPWSPLRQTTFRALWLAVLVGNIGTWVHDVAAAWVMAETTSSPLMVAAVQSATTLPVVLFALVAGTLADSIDRRRYLILAQLWMLSVATLLALLAQLDMLGPWSLLALTFALGTGAAMAMPAQAAIMPELVPRPQLASAISLNSAGMNIARSIGPAIGGVILAQAGPALAFALNALSFVGVILVLWRWQPVKIAPDLPRESFVVGLRAGIRFAWQAPVFQSVLAKAITFFLFASAIPALLPVLVRSELAAGPGTFGLLLGCIGIGAVGGTLLLPRLRRNHDGDALVLVATLACALATIGVACTRSTLLIGLLLLVFGSGWITVLSSLQVAAQLSVPGWVRARALSLYIMVFALGMALGSLAWGALAQRMGVTIALATAALGAANMALVARRFRLGASELLDFTPSAHWPQPLAVEPPAHERGPVMVIIEYNIANEDRSRFLALGRELGRTRRRDGAIDWHLVEDISQPGIWLEYFLVPTWLQHLRQHHRTTADDQRLQQQLRDLHRGQRAPRVRHFIGDGKHAAAMAPHEHPEPAA
ncbi:MFS transporter [Pseudoxanthomonas dokdonensis]|uniref:MFS transporter n=1 Tax=Pseudoxanthomonas dokdonensis TaxID=344882 RepID=A0A0R0CWQ2_9GAMM|nr:MFS transporter [Pseudoxanthomonas dokdonensis]KRG70567.1 MFS transporter [Pseudoxanthomonas dokdonensis]